MNQILSSVEYNYKLPIEWQYRTLVYFRFVKASTKNMINLVKRPQITLRVRYHTKVLDLSKPQETQLEVCLHETRSPAHKDVIRSLIS
jgi:hypothetical protein